MKIIRKTDMWSRKRSLNTFIFIEGLTVLNNGEEFERSFRENYPLQLELKKENDINTEGSFLDLDFKIEDNSFSISIYDKRDDFLFSIVRMLFFTLQYFF